MINTITHVHEECCICQINFKLLPLNEENENFKDTSWTQNMFQG